LVNTVIGARSGCAISTAVLTNREGGFGIGGLAPGKWRINMLDDKKSVFEITIPGNADGLVRVDELKAVKGQ